MKEDAKVEMKLKNMSFSRLSIFRTFAPEYIIAKELVNIIQLPSKEISNNEGNIVEYFNDKETYEIANKNDIFELENNNSKNKLTSLNSNKDDKAITLKIKSDYILAVDNKINRKRFYLADNLRCILIFLVIFGHLLGSFSGPIRRDIFVMIYIFHMPFFIYISGWFAKFNPKKIIRHIFFPYIISQFLYQGTG